MRVINVGLLGYGLSGSTFHAPVIAAVSDLRIVAVSTGRTDDVARELPDARAVSNPQAIFSDPDIELVVVATPNASHFELAERALRAGKHVVIDKPMTTTRAEADALIATAAQTGRLLSVYHNRRFDGDFLTVKALIEANRLGTVYEYETHFDRFRPAIKPGWRERPQHGSGLLFDLGSHLIDQALVLFGMPDTVTADVFAQRPQARVDDYFQITLGYRERRAVLHASTLVCEPGPHFAVHGDGGSFLKYGMDPQEAALKAHRSIDAADFGADEPGHYGSLVTADGERQTIPTERGSYTSFYAGMAAAMAGDGRVPVAAEAARDVITIVELAQRSAAERRTLAL